MASGDLQEDVVKNIALQSVRDSALTRQRVFGWCPQVMLEKFQVRRKEKVLVTV